MTPYLLMKKIIPAKIHQEQEATKRIDTFYAFGKLNDEEYTELTLLITETYTNAA
ncbi:hypothetical protein [Lysinibacillus sp. 54212]|uniref:hypothetical protein n=1 Tax=Lysinibacillus sp. 54212 TaxID=3119829 RepID=UPI002FC874BC